MVIGEAIANEFAAYYKALFEVKETDEEATVDSTPMQSLLSTYCIKAKRSWVVSARNGLSHTINTPTRTIYIIISQTCVKDRGSNMYNV